MLDRNFQGLGHTVELSGSVNGVLGKGEGTASDNNAGSRAQDTKVSSDISSVCNPFIAANLPKGFPPYNFR